MENHGSHGEELQLQNEIGMYCPVGGSNDMTTMPSSDTCIVVVASSVEFKKFVEFCLAVGLLIIGLLALSTAFFLLHLLDECGNTLGVELDCHQMDGRHIRQSKERVCWAHVKADGLLCCFQQRVGMAACNKGILSRVGIKIGPPVHPSPDMMGLDAQKFIFHENSFFWVEVVQSVVSK
jgi:hypothetical protein